MYPRTLLLCEFKCYMLNERYLTGVGIRGIQRSSDLKNAAQANKEYVVPDFGKDQTTRFRRRAIVAGSCSSSAGVPA